MKAFTADSWAASEDALALEDGPLLSRDAQIAKLADWKEKGLLTDEEFSHQTTQLLRADLTRPPRQDSTLPTAAPAAQDTAQATAAKPVNLDAFVIAARSWWTNMWKKVWGCLVHHFVGVSVGIIIILVIIVVASKGDKHQMPGKGACLGRRGGVPLGVAGTPPPPGSVTSFPKCPICFSLTGCAILPM